MLRLLGFFGLVILLTMVLGRIPVIGGLFARTGFIGIWVTAIALSWAIGRYGERVYHIRRDSAVMRQLTAVESAHNQGKLGTLLFAQGRRRRAIPHLQRAVEGEPEVAEWHYRLGATLLATGAVDEAADTLARAVAIEEEHAYGAAQMRLAEARMLQDRLDEALDALAVFERNHGPSPESAYRRGRVHKLAGRRDDAQRAFAEVPVLAAEAARYQRRQAGWWTLRAKLGGLF